ncbi:propanoyl-CoA acyltransferase [Dehalococcoidia bacterium]|nr:propanoyl-CoA acyltransferase [Dehalococcoidia bacterium]
MREVAVIGVGMTRFGVSQNTNIEMFSEAAMEAINESNLKPKDIEALFLGNMLGSHEEGQVGMAAYAAADIGIPNIPTTRFEGICASASVAIRDAFMWVASGHYDIVLVGGTEKASVMDTPYATRTLAMGSDSYYEGPAGITFPGIFAMLAHLYSHKYAIPLPKLKEQMAMVAIKNHQNGKLNPKAQFQATIRDLMEARIARATQRGEPVPTWADEMEFLRDIKVNPVIADPLQLYDCCPFSDGAAALVLASRDKARRLTDKPVLIAGVGQCSAGPLHNQKDFTRMKARILSAKQAYTQAGIEPQDVDLCELHDCFTIAEIVATECLGFFEFGQGSQAVERGETQIGAKIAINPSGGLKAKGHPIGATGAAQVCEVVKQLRGECGKRQVEGARIGMTDTLGGDACTLCNIILKRGW